MTLHVGPYWGVGDSSPVESGGVVITGEDGDWSLC
jgi:hypothetical protein